VILSVSAGAATVIGAVVGALAALLAELLRQVIELVRGQRLDRRISRGVAKVWSKSLCDFDELLCRYVVRQVVEGRPPTWWPPAEDVDIQIPLDDMKHVAAAASARQWKEIDWAQTHVRTLRAACVESRNGEPPKVRARDLWDAMCQIKKATLKLAEVGAEEPGFEWRDKYDAELKRLKQLAEEAVT